LPPLSHRFCLLALTSLARSAGAAEAAFTARRGVKLRNLSRRGFDDPLNHKLSDSIPACDVKRFMLIGVDHDDSHLAAITSIDKARRVNKRYSVTRSETASRQNEPGIPARYRYRDAGWYHRPLAGFEHEIDPAWQVEARVAFVLISRHRQVFVQKFYFNLDHLFSSL
jgi:hypothetical protein